MKKAYDILRNLYGKSPMEEIVKFKSELNAIGDKHDFYNIVWDEAFHQSGRMDHLKQ